MIRLAKRLAYQTLVRLFPSRMGYTLRPKGLGYFDAKTIQKLAAEAGLPLTQFLESTNHGGVGKRRDAIVDELVKLSALPACKCVVEIGAGTGMYMEKVLEKCGPEKYEVYETSPGWVKYLSTHYSTDSRVLIHDANGHDLSQTKSETADLITAHGVFVYLPAVTTFEYLAEAARVCKPGGLLIFDCFTEAVFSLKGIYDFKEKNPHYDFPVVTFTNWINEFCDRYNFNLKNSFNIPYHYTFSTYFVLEKQTNTSTFSKAE